MDPLEGLGILYSEMLGTEGGSSFSPSSVGHSRKFRV